MAVHLARAAWVLAAQPPVKAAVEDGFAANITVPVYLGDALQLRFRTGDMFAEHNVAVQVEDEENTELVFPVSLVDRAETFNALMSDVAEVIEKFRSGPWSGRNSCKSESIQDAAHIL